MSDSESRDRRSLTLLVQLFGREVLDTLARAGFGNEAAIARAGPDRLATESGVSLPLAQRIVALVEETRAPSPAPRSRTPHGPARAPRQPRRKKTPALPSDAETPATRIETAPVPTPADADEADPFVDDVALVSWMGFSSKTPSGRLSFSVADGIFDHTRPEPPALEEAHRAGQEEARQEEPEGALRAAPEEEPVPPATSAATGTPPHTLPGSFWSFGRPGEPAKTSDHEVARPSGPPTDPQVSAGAPRRRIRHDH